VDILKELSVEKDIVDLLQVQTLTYFGHVNCMGNYDRFPKLLLHSYTHGHRSRGRPKKKWLDNIHEDCEEMNLSILQASCFTWNQTKWRNCSQFGLPKREDNVIVDKAISQVSHRPRNFYLLLEFWDPSISRERLNLETSNTFTKAYRLSSDLLSLNKFM